MRNSIIVDEAGLNSVKQGANLMKFAIAHNCRIIFAGDAKQHTSVEAGDFFRLIGEYSNITKARLTDIRRQKALEYRNAVKAIAAGEVEEAFNSFDAKGWVINGKGQYIRNAALDFIELTEGGKNLQKCIAVAPTHRECDVITLEIRNQLKNKSIIRKKGNIRTTFRSFSWTNSKKSKISNYKPGQEVCVIKALDDNLMSIGTSFRIKKVSGENIILYNGKKLNIEKNFNRIEVGETVDLEICKGDLIMFTANAKEGGIINGRFALADKKNFFKLLDEKGNIQRTIKLSSNFTAMKYGFVSTSHKAQGQTKDNVVIAAESMDQKAFYVATSRGRENMRLHCPDKKILYNCILKSTGDRRAALDVEPEIKSLLNPDGKGFSKVKEQDRILFKERIQFIKQHPETPSEKSPERIVGHVEQIMEQSYVGYSISK